MQRNGEPESNMTEADWAIYLAPQGVSRTPSLPAHIEKHTRSGNGEVTIPVLCKERSSAKASFFITEDSISGIYGFWCPKKLIIKETFDKVILPKWFTVNIIEYT